MVLPGYVLRGTKYTGITLQTIQGKEIVFLLENDIGGGFSSVLGDRYVKSDENKKIFHVFATNLYGCAMSESPPNDEIKLYGSVILEVILYTPDDSNIGYLCWK